MFGSQLWFHNGDDRGLCPDPSRHCPWISLVPQADVLEFSYQLSYEHFDKNTEIGRLLKLQLKRREFIYGTQCSYM